MPKVLVIDDDPAIALFVKAALEATDVQVVSTTSAASGLSAAAADRPAVIVLDVLLPDQVGLATLVEIRRRDPTIPVIVITGRGANEHAIDAIRLGAHDFLFKPLKVSEVRRVLLEAVERRAMVGPAATTRSSKPSAKPAELLVGRSPAMQRLYKQIGCAVTLQTPVLIQGESGSGKELAARSIHLHSRGAAARFVIVPCAHECAAEVAAQLFGPDGAKGALAEAAGGTLFLDEIAALPISVQGQLIRRLESPAGLGGVRLVAATQHSLTDRVAAGQFRADLCYFLAGCQVCVPPLRERLDDLPALVEAMLERLCQSAGRLAPRTSPEALARLSGYAWPGNVRELSSVLKQALLRTPGPEILSDALPVLPGVAAPASSLSHHSAAVTDWERFVAEWLSRASDSLYEGAVIELERQVLAIVLRRTGGNQARAAKLLGITRSNLRRKIRESGVVIERKVDVHDGAGG